MISTHIPSMHEVVRRKRFWESKPKYRFDEQAESCQAKGIKCVRCVPVPSKEDLQSIANLVNGERLRAPYGPIYGMLSYEEAFHRLESQNSMTKIILKMR